MRGYLLLLIGALIVGIAIATSGVPAQDNSAAGKQQKVDKTEFESQFPLVDFNKPEPSDQKKRSRWEAKGKKYKGVGLSVTEDSGLITFNTEWDVGLPALPVAKSDLIVIGEVVDAEALLSRSKDWVYSEFTIRVDEVLKNTSNVALTQGSSIIADRDGGGVRFPGGRVTIQYIAGQGMPRVGRRYTLFLTGDAQGQSFHILTGYELRGGQVIPIDNPAGGTHPIAIKYKGADEVSFLSDLRSAIANVP
jgi:hypothetical protein